MLRCPPPRGRADERYGSDGITLTSTSTNLHALATTRPALRTRLTVDLESKARDTSYYNLSIK